MKPPLSPAAVAVLAATASFPEFRCHKKVRALQIAGILTEFVRPQLAFVEPGVEAFEVDAAWVERHKPEVGGYFVVYEDGYFSYSPQEAFEAGYHLIPAAAAKVAERLSPDDFQQLANASGLPVVDGETGKVLFEPAQQDGEDEQTDAAVDPLIPDPVDPPSSGEFAPRAEN